MTRTMAGLLGLMISIPGAVMTVKEFRAGRAKLFFTGAVSPLLAERAVSPAYFWAFTAINALFLTALILVCGVMLVAP